MTHISLAINQHVVESVRRREISVCYVQVPLCIRSALAAKSNYALRTNEDILGLQ